MCSYPECWLSSTWCFSSQWQDEKGLLGRKKPKPQNPKQKQSTDKTRQEQTKNHHTNKTFLLQILSTSMINTTTSVVLCGTWPFRIPGLPEVKNVSKPQDLNSVSFLKIRNWPGFRMDVIQILTESELVCSAVTWTNMTALVYSHICLKAFINLPGILPETVQNHWMTDRGHFFIIWTS